MSNAKGNKYVPEDKPPGAVVEKGEFTFAAIGLDHGHIYGMSKGLIAAGAMLKWVYDPDPQKVEKFKSTFPDVQAAESEDQIYQDKDVKMVAAAAVPSERCALGLRVMDHGKDYFTDKCPFTTLDQLAQARKKAEETNCKYMVFYGERLGSECGMYAGTLIEQGAIGRVLQVIGMGPHRLNAPSRPEWFFQKEKYGGIICDIGSHQAEQFLYYAGAKDGQVLHSKVANYDHKQYPELEDFGDAALLADNGATNYFRIDWFTPDALNAFGDGRTFILGTKGYIEMRKYVDVAGDAGGNHLFLVDDEGEYNIPVAGKIGTPFFGQLILDCLNRTENAMTQEHAFKAAELSLLAQDQAIRVE